MTCVVSLLLLYYLQEQRITFCESMLAVPMRTCLPDAADTGLAVLAVRGVLNAASMVPGLPPPAPPPCVPGRTTPLIGRPD